MQLTKKNQKEEDPGKCSCCDRYVGTMLKDSVIPLMICRDCDLAFLNGHGFDGEKWLNVEKIKKYVIDKYGDTGGCAIKWD